MLLKLMTLGLHEEFPAQIMKIEKLVLNGFKSFAEKTTFSLHPGMTCIVGPNGCGKSNVVDAFRWVLGEQNARTLRGSKMEEVIFNGTAGKKQKGMSEVVLHISGMNHIESENGRNRHQITTVSRRLYRSGESEYYIDKQRNRLKDIRDLFLDTGLEVRNYSIIEQEKISEVLIANPTNRRFLIEEVAGVMKYKIRKHEALGKLERSRDNLNRINDIIHEVRRSINSLDRQAKKAEKYKKLTERRNLIELKSAKKEFTDLLTLYESLEKENAELSSLITGKTAIISQMESDTEGGRLELLDREKTLEEKTAALQTAEREIAAIEKDIALREAEINNIKGHIERLNSQRGEFHEELDSTASKMEALQKSEAELAASIETLTTEIRKEEDRIQSVEKFIKSAEEELRTKHRELFKVSEDISSIKNEISQCETHITSLKNKKSSSETSMSLASNTLKELDERLDTIGKELNEKERAISLSNEERESLASDIDELDDSVEELRNTISAAREELASNKARLKSLREIKMNERGTFSMPDDIEVVALISEIMDVPVEYEVSVESALGVRLKGVVVKDREALKAVVGYSKKHSKERRAFTAPDMAAEKRGNGSSPLGVKIGDKVKGRFPEIIASILENIRIVDSLDEAIEFHMAGSTKGNSSLCYVTTEGDVIEPSGMVFTGTGTNILRHIREIRELEAAVTSQSKGVQEIEEKLADLHSERDDKREKLQEVETKRAVIVKEASGLKVKMDKESDEKGRLEKKIGYLTIEIGEAEKDMNVYSERRKERAAALDRIGKNKLEIENASEKLRNDISEKSALAGKLRSAFTDIKMTLTKEKERLRAAGIEQTSLNRKIDFTRERIEKIDMETESLKNKSKENREVIEAKNIEVKDRIKEADNQKSTIKSEKEFLDNKSTILYDKDQNIKNLRNETDTLKQKANEVEIHLAEARVRMEAIEKNVQDHFGREIASFEVPPLEEGEEEELDELKKKIDAMGPVNMASIQEYDELKKRYDFLLTQQEDISKSIAELEEAIAKINSTTRKRLRDAFTILNETFGKTFQSLFGGGKAELVLLEPNNILESGIDIVVQPPGKKLQNINLLSGGEKTLSALALIFSGFLIKPTPLCILDEADAALDESNTRRFKDMLKELSRNIQFIVITHNRITMEASDYIYGITAEESGVSSVVSMEMAEEAA